MHVLDIMTKKPATIHVDGTLRAALETMEKVGCHHLPVVSKEGHMVGVVSDRDLRMALNSPHTFRDRWQDDEIANHVLVRSVMTPAPIVVEPHTSAEEAARLMLMHQIGCLPVMRSETLVGILTRSDIIIAFINIHRRLDDVERYKSHSH